MKKLVSFRLDPDRLEELQELASVYTQGNSTALLEALIRRMYFLEPLALHGVYRSGFGISRSEQRRFAEAWDIWVTNSASMDSPPEPEQLRVYTHGRSYTLPAPMVKAICKAVGLAYNPTQAFNLYAYWG